MKRRLSATLLAGGVLAGSLMMGTTSAHAGTGAFMLKNAATGLCLQGSLSQSTNDTRGVPCNRGDSSQWWGNYKSMIIMPSTSISVCLVSTPSWSALTSSCSDAAGNGWSTSWATSGDTNTLVAGKNCYLGMGSAGAGNIGYCTPGQGDNYKRWTKVY
ncbi:MULTISPECIES: hypothetical protein [Streptomyces]|uniref:hypothetical protein n=1 Tax=Streptomyces TaxID=1883 RepID=UPI000F6F0AD1|nr:hypothetical protein [Streptomyces sp. W1SF4]AZM93575.1 hypothetical protein D1J60_34015 [Streptomyces sp. W1SF4]